MKHLAPVCFPTDCLELTSRRPCGWVPEGSAGCLFLQKVERFLENGIAVIELLIADAKWWKQVHHLAERPYQYTPFSRKPAQYFACRVQVALLVGDHEIKGCDGPRQAHTPDSWVACQNL